MASSLYSGKALELKRKHFINQYPPFNVTTGREVRLMDERKDLLLYIHIPFCPAVCSYCFYKKFGNPSDDVVETYLQYLKKEIVLFSQRPEVAGKAIRTMYFGGGTPTILSERQLEDLILFLRSRLHFHPETDFCCEAMPHETTLGQEKLELLKALGVTRISFGVENFNDEILRQHNRRSNKNLYHRIYQMAQDIGFEKINLDIMSGMQGETWDNWTQVIDTLLEWSPPSVSIYKTEVFYNTTLFARVRAGNSQLSLMSDDEEIRHIRYAHERLQSEGGYIVANCVHLVKHRRYEDLHYKSYWQGGELKGLGLSAHSSYEGFLHQNTTDMREYFSMIEEGRLPIKRAHRMSARERISEAMVYGLKNLALSRQRFMERFGFDMVVLYGGLINRLIRRGVLILDDQFLRVAPDYYIFVDDICRQFFLPEYENMMLAHVARDAATEQLVSLTSGAVRV